MVVRTVGAAILLEWLSGNRMIRTDALDPGFHPQCSG